jgi:hypothetical protein
MKNYIFFFSLIFLASCSDGESKSKEDESVGFLTNGKWNVVQFDGEKNRLNIGVVFSKDNQIFNLDSQGRIVPTHNKKVFEVKSDTLRIVDFNYEKKFIHNKGTLVFRIKELTDSKMILKSIYPDSTSAYTLKNKEL